MSDIKELLKPRYKVIADYPGNDIPIGYIITDVDYYTRRNVDFDKWPHIFKKLEWWEDRKPEEMPEYLKVKSTKGIFKVSDLVSGVYKNYLMNYLPATKEEYENQNK